MKRRSLLVVSLILVFLFGISVFAFGNGYLYEKNIEGYKPLKYVISREYKFLLDPAPFTEDKVGGFRKVWDRVKKIAINGGYKVEESEDPFKESISTKEYMDTEDFALRKLGYVLRVQQKFKKGKPSSSFKFTAKYISTNLYKVIASDLRVKEGIKASSEIEENVSPKKESGLKSYYETAWKVKSKKPIENTIGAWASLYPLIGEIGFSSDMRLSGQKAYSFKATPGKVVFPDGTEVEIEIEVWARSMDGKPIVAECSYTMDVPDYYGMKEALSYGEDFLSLLKEKMGDLEFPDYYKWNGSKVRVLLNLPIK